MFRLFNRLTFVKILLLSALNSARFCTVYFIYSVPKENTPCVAHFFSIPLITNYVFKWEIHVDGRKLVVVRCIFFWNGVQCPYLNIHFTCNYDYCIFLDIIFLYTSYYSKIYSALEYKSKNLNSF